MIRDILNELVDKTTRSRDYPSDAINTALSEIKKEVLGCLPKENKTYYHGQKNCTENCECYSGLSPRPCRECLENYSVNKCLTDTRESLEGVFK